jgi:hypothetical protein
MKRALPILLIVLIACACGSATPPGNDGDAGMTFTPDANGDPHDAATGSVQVGTGFEMFEAVTPGETMTLTRGPQGGGQFFGFHIWTGAKLTDYPYGVANIRAEILDAATREVRAMQERNTPVMPDGADKVIFGIAPRIDDCCKVNMKPIIMHVVINSPDGPFADNEVQVMAGVCLDANMAPLCH